MTCRSNLLNSRPQRIGFYSKLEIPAYIQWLTDFKLGARVSKIHDRISITHALVFIIFSGCATLESSSADGGNTVRISPGLFQPIAADDVAAFVADVALAPPRNGIVEIAGPERAPFNEIVARYLKAVGDPRKVVSDPEARYYGSRVEERSLVPLGEARLGRIGFDEWLRRSQAAA